MALNLRTRYGNANIRKGNADYGNGAYGNGGYTINRVNTIQTTSQSRRNGFDD
jgi:hypothetical protein